MVALAFTKRSKLVSTSSLSEADFSSMERVRTSRPATRFLLSALA